MTWYWRFWGTSQLSTLSVTEGCVNWAKDVSLEGSRPDAQLLEEYPLPFVDLEKTTTDELEKILVRVEIFHAKWMGARFTNPRVLARDSHSNICCVMPPYLVEVTWDHNGLKTAWLDGDVTRNKIEEYIFPLGWHVCRHLEPETGILYIAGVRERAEGTGHGKIKIVKFKIIGEKNKVSKLSEHDTDWPNAPSVVSPALLIQGGYLIITMDNIHIIYLVHLSSGKVATCPVHGTDMGWRSFSSRHITSSHLIQVEENQFAVFKLPSEQELDSSESIMIRRTHVGSLPHELTKLHVYERSNASFLIVGTTQRGDHDGEDARTHLHLLTLDLDEHSSTCYTHEDDEYNVAGNMTYFVLAPCSATSRSTLGVLGVRVSAPAHTPSGRRIARRTRAATVYNLGIKVTVGREGDERPSISLAELDLLDGEASQAGKTVDRIKYFDPYAGQIILQERDAKRYSFDYTVLDYVSP